MPKKLLLLMSFAFLMVVGLTFIVIRSVLVETALVSNQNNGIFTPVSQTSVSPGAIVAVSPQLLLEPTLLLSVTPTLPVAPTPSVTSIEPVNNFALNYDYKPVPQKTGTVRIPILTYHHIEALPKASSAKPYFVTPQMFEQQLQYLKEKNYHTITSKEFILLIKSGKNPSSKTVMLTFDDGNSNNYYNAYKLLKKYGFVGVFYVNTKRLKISAQQLKEMADNGMSIDSHTASHLDLTKVTDEKTLIAEISTSKAVLEKITKHTIYSVSYPGCVYNDKVVKIAVAAGYKFGVSCGKSIDHYSTRVFALSRMHVYNDFENFKRRLSGYWIVP